MFFLSGVFFVASLLQAAEIPNDWVTRLEVSDRSALAAMNLKPAGGAVRIRVSDPATGSSAEIALSAGNTRCRLLPAKFFPKETERRLVTQPCPALTNALCWFTFKRTEDAWIGYIDDQQVLRLPELWSGLLHLQHAPDVKPGEKEQDDYTQRLGSFKFEDNFLVPAGSEFPPTWEIMSGLWKLHSVTGSISGSSGGYQLARQT